MANFAIMGFGTVGGGVAEVLRMNSAAIAEKLGEPLNLKYILDVRDLSATPYADKAVKDFSILENDPELDVVVESIGGAKVALEFTRRCLLAGKHVVTSNKELVASHGRELLEIAREKNVNYLFEASVGGGIPVLRPLFQCLAGNQIQEIAGILNGTTNYILTRMIRAGLSFEAALKEAQQNGYAEHDPTADIEGHDACRKICILSDLAFGRHVYPAQVSTEGISHITLADVAYADACGRKIKLLGRAIRREDGKFCVYVAPHLVDGEDPLSGVEDVFNAITVRGNAVGDVMFYGRGAGKRPTASAVVADVVDAAKHRKTKKYLHWGPGDADLVVSPDTLESAWYVRMNASIEGVREALGEVSALARPGAPAGEVAFLTGPMTAGVLAEKLAGLGTPASQIRVLDKNH